ncbi:Holliday junction resolvase-like protein [Tardisphaera miroshnichenkoae]
MDLLSLFIITAFGVALLGLLIAYARDERELSRLREKTLEEARKQYELWKSAELRADYVKLREEAMREAELALQRWKSDVEKKIREDAAQRSSSVKLGKVAEQLVPISLQGTLGADLEDFRFLGSPVDYVVFRGLSKGSLTEVLFLEVKSGAASDLSEREREVKKAIEDKRVGFLTYRLADEKSI